MGLGSTTETVPLDSTLETLTFGGPNDVNRFALPEQVNFEGCAQFQPLCAGTTLQSNFPHYLERTNLGARTTLAILLNFQQFANLLILSLGPRPFLGS